MLTELAKCLEQFEGATSCIADVVYDSGKAVLSNIADLPNSPSFFPGAVYTAMAVTTVAATLSIGAMLTAIIRLEEEDNERDPRFRASV